MSHLGHPDRCATIEAWASSRELWALQLKPQGPELIELSGARLRAHLEVACSQLDWERKQVLGEVKPAGGGRALGYDPADSLSEGLARLESLDLVDDDNCPAWALWLEVRDVVRHGSAARPCLVVWVPSYLQVRAEAAVRATHGCLFWLDDVETGILPTASTTS